MAGRIVTSTINDDTGVLATQNGMTGIPKAWCNFNGTSGASIRASYNVSSITRNSTGVYTVNLTTAMANANYAVCGGVAYQAGFASNPVFEVDSTAAISTSSFQFYVVTGNQSVTDANFIYFAVLGT